MSAVPTQKSKKESNSSDISMSESTRVLISFIALLLVSSALSDDLGSFGAMGVALLIALGMYFISFMFFKRKSTHRFRHPLSDSTRIYVSVVALIYMSANLSNDLGLLKNIGIAFLFAVGAYAMSFIFFLREVPPSFRVPLNGWIRCLVSGLLAGSVSSGLKFNLGFLGSLGILVLLCLGTYTMSFLFFSKKVDTRPAATEESATSECS